MRIPKLTFRPGRQPGPAAPPRPAKMPRLILHAGSPKTGTTGIQYALSENRDHLQSIGVWYPRIDAFFPVNPKLPRARAHFAFANALAGDTPADRKRIARFVGAMAARAQDCDTIVLSAETLYRLTAKSAPGEGRQTPQEKRMRFLARLAAVTRGFEPEILLYLRRVDRFAESLYAESIVQTDTTDSFEDFLRKKRNRFDYRRQIDMFAAHFPVRVRNFEAAAQSGLMASFCADAGIAADLPVRTERRRPSISNAATLWLRRAKEETPGMGVVERDRRWQFALRPENADLFQTRARTGFWSDPAKRNAFIAIHQSAVTEIAFPAAADGAAPLARWTDTRHAEAQRQFHAWQAANRARLRRRERNRIPPYVLDG